MVKTSRKSLYLSVFLVAGLLYLKHDPNHSSPSQENRAQELLPPESSVLNVSSETKTKASPLPVSPSPQTETTTQGLIVNPLDHTRNVLNERAPEVTINSSDSPHLILIDKLNGNGKKDRWENNLGWFETSRTPTDYLVGIGIIANEDKNPIVWIKAKSTNPRPWGSIVYVVDIEQWAGKELKISASIKGDEVDLGILWASSSNKNLEQLTFVKKQFYQTFDWHRHEVILSVPPDARKFQIGLTLDGKKSVFMKDLRLETTGKKQ